MKAYYLIIVLSIYISSVSAQGIRRTSSSKRPATVSDKFWQPEKIIVGGNIGPLFFGGNQNMIGLNLLTGYRVTPNFWPGLSFNFSNYTERVIVYDLSGQPQNAKYAISSFGTGIFLRYKLFNFLMPSVELERNWLVEKRPYYDIVNSKVARQNTTYGSTSLLVGGGIYRGGDAAGSYLLILYDVLYNTNKVSPYNGNLTLKVGYMLSDIFKTKK